MELFVCAIHSFINNGMKEIHDTAILQKNIINRVTASKILGINQFSECHKLNLKKKNQNLRFRIWILHETGKMTIPAKKPFCDAVI